MKSIIITAIMLLSLNVGVQAQSVVKSGNTFTQVSNGKPKGKEVKTQYTFKDSKGDIYPVYLSASGKAYIIRVSKKTRKEYKQYVPEIGKQINPKAYKDNK